MKKQLKINSINIGGETQCREVIDQPLVMQYLEEMKEGDEFPDIDVVFDGSTHWLVDGFHRYHAYKMLGLNTITVNVKEGTLYDAQLAALEANSKHGKSLTNEDKHKKVVMALSMQGFSEKSDREIAKLCRVSHPFVAAIRNPEVKEQQHKNIEKHVKGKSQNGINSSVIYDQHTGINSTGNEIIHASKDLPNGSAPDEDEIKASELAIQYDQEVMYKLLESDDALRTAYAEIKTLNFQIAQQEVRMHGIMNERNEAVKMVKELQKQVEKMRKVK